MKIIIPKKPNKISGLIFFLISHNFTLKMKKNQKKYSKNGLRKDFRAFFHSRARNDLKYGIIKGNF